MAVGVHCILYDWRVTGLYAVTMFPGWLYQAQRTLSAKAQLVSSVETPLMPEGQTVNLSALAVPAPTREPRATAAPRPAAARALLIVRDFFSFAFVCRVSGWPSVSSVPQRLDGEPGDMPHRVFLDSHAISSLSRCSPGRYPGCPAYTGAAPAAFAALQLA